ncbi:MAG: hypothetical protein HN764_08425 [Gammaproteobacteria bacterium]|jgi:hypothetical protein|nr:hypothetical protein [Gammaproteobacteria bacterium]
MRSFNQYFHFCLSSALFSVCPLVFAAGYYGDGPYIDADINIRYEDNLSRTSKGSEVEEDMVTALSAGGGYVKKLDDKSQLMFSAYLAHEHFAEFTDLNNVAVNTSMIYTIQPNKGYTQPWYEISLNLTKLKFNKSNIRDSFILNTQASAGKRFTDRLTARLAYSYERRYSDGDVFDTENHELDSGIIYSYSPRIALFANYRLSLGEVVSTARPNPIIIAASESVAPDDVFTSGTGPGCANRRCAYRIDALSHHFEVGMEFNLSQTVSLDLSGRYFIVDGNGIESYKGWIYGAGLYIQF